MTSVPVSSPYGASLKTILIIEDDVHLAATFALGLEANGYRALCAPNAAIGWEMAHAHLPDLILCDIDMPGMDGRRLLTEMRADVGLADRQFVLMTGKPAFGNQRAAMDLGADDFLMKPFTHATLLSCVAARLRRAELSRRVDDRAVDQLRENLDSTLPQRFFLPLASILGITQLLEAELDTESKEDIRQDLRGIRAAGRRLHRTLRNYLLILDVEPHGGPGILYVEQPCALRFLTCRYLSFRKELGRHAVCQPDRVLRSEKQEARSVHLACLDSQDHRGTTPHPYRRSGSDVLCHMHVLSVHFSDPHHFHLCP